MTGEFPGAGPYRPTRFVGSVGGMTVTPASPPAMSAFGIWPGGGPFRALRFAARELSSYMFTLSGVTRGSNGGTLANCTVDLFLTGDNSFIATTVSDDRGNYSFKRGNNLAAYAVAYRRGSPDVSGTTANTLTGV